MVQRYVPQGNMADSPDGSFVSFADYAKLESLLAESLNDAAEYFKQVESGQLSAADANNVLRVTVRLG